VRPTHAAPAAAAQAETPEQEPAAV
jgi:hypothetical protein